MHIAVSGSHGLVGSALAPFLMESGHRVTRIVRGAASENEIGWSPEDGRLDATSEGDIDAIIHLAGENIATGRWTLDKKRRIRESRVNATRLLCERLASMETPPKTLLCASAIGIYGNRGEATLCESDGPGVGFLAEIAQAWEASTEPAVAVGIRVVLLRFGMILSPKGGALAKMLTPFQLGGGGIVGSGRQFWSWIALDDVVRAIQFLLTCEALSGPVNLVAPNPVTNLEFSKSLGRVLSRPTVVPMPAFVARLALGQMADELLLSSTRVEPRRLLEAGFSFRHPELEEALRFLLGR